MIIDNYINQYLWVTQQTKYSWQTRFSRFTITRTNSKALSPGLDGRCANRVMHTICLFFILTQSRYVRLRQSIKIVGLRQLERTS